MKRANHIPSISKSFVLAPFELILSTKYLLNQSLVSVIQSYIFIISHGLTIGGAILFLHLQSSHIHVNGL